MGYLQVFLLLLGLLAVVAIWRFPRKSVVLSFPIGVETMASSFTELIPAGVTLPFYFSDIFWSGAEGQDRFALHLMQDLGDGLRKIDTITIGNLPPRPARMVEMELRLIISKKKRLTVWTKSKESKHLQRYGPYVLED
jgi:molecular chaperone DnaK (HSP70)